MGIKTIPIGIVHYTAPSKEIGGVETVINYHTRILSREGYRVRLIYGKGGRLDYAGVQNLEIPLLSPSDPRVENIQEDLLSKGSSKDFEPAKKEIKQELSRALKGINVLIVHNIISMPFNFAATAAINEFVDESKIRAIFWLHDSALLREEWKEKFGKFPLTLLHHRGTNVRYVTPSRARALELDELPEPYRIPKSEVRIIPNGVSVHEYLKFDSVTLQLMKRLGLSFDDFVIVVPVRVTPRKNIELSLLVIRELKRLIGKLFPIKLIITGPPDHQAIKKGVRYLEYLREMIEESSLKENVIFCYEIIAARRRYQGWRLVKWGVADAYTLADIVFVPSREEGFGLPVIEAGAARRPLFCSRIAPFRELVRDDLEAHMFSLDDDPRDIALRIYRFLMEDKVERNFSNVSKNFSWKYIVKKKLIPLLRK
ncbi:MAG: glycosyltransferase family 4 protein [Candidatus Bathyarchaeia archaeon]